MSDVERNVVEPIVVTATGVVVTSQLNVIGSGVSLMLLYPLSVGLATDP